MAEEIHTGSCLCGGVAYRVTGPMRRVTACHCKQCQTWTGGGPLLAIRAKDVMVEGADNIRTYNASEWGERASCGICGSILYWTMKGKPPAFLALGLFEDQSDLRLTEEIFIDHRPAWLPAMEGANQSTEAEQQALLQAYLEKKE